MNIEQLIDARYSCRNYSDKPVDKKLVEDICLMAAKAPSACNSQPWKIHALYGEKKTAAAAALEGLDLNAHAKAAPVLLAIEETSARYISRFQGIVQPNQWAKYDLGILAAHIVLLAKEKGLDSCIIGFNNPEAVKKALNTENDVPLFITIGYANADDVAPTKKRKAKDEIFIREE